MQAVAAPAALRAAGGVGAQWRQHFLDVMRPEFLPPHWGVDGRTINTGEWGDEFARGDEIALY